MVLYSLDAYPPKDKEFKDWDLDMTFTAPSINLNQCRSVSGK
jgi:hypothetical protein